MAQGGFITVVDLLTVSRVAQATALMFKIYKETSMHRMNSQQHTLKGNLRLRSISLTHNATVQVTRFQTVFV